MNKALFIDRDGVINIEKNYLHKIDDFEFIDGVFESLQTLSQFGFLNIIVTNQSGIARGYYSESDYEKLTNWMIEQFYRKNILISKVYHCPHSNDSTCECRKPNPGMILRAAEEFNINLEESWLIGDKESDITAGKKAGVKNLVLSRSGHPIDSTKTKAKFVVDSIANLPNIMGLE